VKPILPPATLGVLGGGQLGRLFCNAAQRMGYRVAVLDPDRDAPALQVADVPIVGRYDDPAALAQLASVCAAVTVELESLPASAVASLARDCRVAPGAEAIAIAQDRLREKRFLRAIGLPVVPFVEVLAARDLESAGCYPGILKSARNGYDGRGQCAVANSDAALEAWRAFGELPCVLERQIPLDQEVSVIVARGADGAIRSFPPAENRHRDGILELSVVPARVPAALAARAAASAASIAEHLGYVGVLGVEFFVSKCELIVNEFAPRPHNSGHYTIEACATSQFEQQVRALCGLPLGETALRHAAAMANILGDAWRQGEPDFGWLRSTAGATLHLYGKRAASARRKMGHVTFLGKRSRQLAERALRRLSGARIPGARGARGRSPVAPFPRGSLHVGARNASI